MTPLAAIRQAALLRFRPILMTTLAALLGAMPLALGSGYGSEIRQPLGIVMIVGFLALGLFSKNYNRWENNVVQTAGTAAGQIAFLCWLLAAFDMLAAEPGSGFSVHLTRLQTWIWLSISGTLGVLLAVPLRKHFIDDEKLPFPDGIAAGETLIMLDARDAQAFTLQRMESIVDDVVIRRFDHKHLNKDTAEFASLNPSVENITKTCHDLLRQPIADAGATLRRVTVWVSRRMAPDTSASSMNSPGSKRPSRGWRQRGKASMPQKLSALSTMGW
jgi:hypothetical protein